MDSKLAHQKILSDLDNSNKVLIILSVLSAFGILIGISIFVLNNIWINIPNSYPTYIFSASTVLLALSYLINKNTQRLSEAVRGVEIEA
jgi:hypothetical protein